MDYNIDIVDWSTGQVFRSGVSPESARTWIEGHDWKLVEEQTDVYPDGDIDDPIEIITYYIEPNSEKAAAKLRPQ